MFGFDLSRLLFILAYGSKEQAFDLNIISFV